MGLEKLPDKGFPFWFYYQRGVTKSKWHFLKMTEGARRALMFLPAFDAIFLINNAHRSMNIFLNQRWDTPPIPFMPEIHNPPIYSTMIKTPVCCRHCSSTKTTVNKTMKIPSIYSTGRDRQTKHHVSGGKHLREAWSGEGEQGLQGWGLFAVFNMPVSVDKPMSLEIWTITQLYMKSGHHKIICDGR